MHHQDSSARPEASTLDQDRQIEFAVLDFLLVEHPAQVTQSEAVEYLNGHRAEGSPCFAETDPVDRAVGQLVGAGLARRHGGCVVPSGAARHFAWLTD